MSQTYGATAELVEDEYFPDRISNSGSADLTMAAQKIESVAGDVEIEVRAASVDPEVITELDSPLAYRWLQRTILLGAAVQYGRTSSHQSPVVFDGWQAEFDERMRRLRFDAKAILADVPPSGSDSVDVYDIYR